MAVDFEKLKKSYGVKRMEGIVPCSVLDELDLIFSIKPEGQSFPEKQSLGYGIDLEVYRENVGSIITT